MYFRKVSVSFLYSHENCLVPKVGKPLLIYFSILTFYIEREKEKSKIFLPCVNTNSKAS